MKKGEWLMINEQKQELKKRLIAEEAARMLLNRLDRFKQGVYRINRPFMVLPSDVILAVVDAFEEAKKKFDESEVRASVPDLCKSNNQEIGEAETSPNPGGDAAIERCPGDSYD